MTLLSDFGTLTGKYLSAKLSHIYVRSVDIVGDSLKAYEEVNELRARHNLTPFPIPEHLTLYDEDEEP